MLDDFEGSPDYTRVGALELGNDPETGKMFANAAEADVFSEDISQDVEGLLYLGYLTSGTTIFGHSFVLKTLSRGERLAVLQFCSTFNDSIGLAQALETATLALAIVAVDGRPISIPLTPADAAPNLVIERNWNTVTQWYDPVLDSLYLQFRELENRMFAAFHELQSKSTAGRLTP